MKRKNLKMPPVQRIQYMISDEQFADFQAALDHYHFWNNAAFVQACVDALIRANKNGDELPRELRFEALPKR